MLKFNGKNVVKGRFPNNEVDYSELECDFVSTRIVELLQEDYYGMKTYM